jgi:DNA-binding NarL/FixJ family response regulator
MLRDLIHAMLAREPDVQVVGELSQDDASLRVVTGADADVVIAGLRDSDIPDVCEQLLGSRPATRIICLSSDGRQGYECQTGPHLVALGEVSPAMLLDLLRQWGPKRV